MPTVVLDIGDRDKHGEDIYIAAAEDAVAWVGEEGYVWPVSTGASVERLAALSTNPDPGPALIFVRLALTTAQATELDLLDADGKAEVDGVPVPVMDRWLTDAIEALQNPACRDSLLAEEKRQRDRLPDAIRNALDKAA